MNKFHLLPLSIILLFLLSSCITTPNIRSLSPESREQLASLQVFRDTKLPKESYKVIKEIEGISCKRNLYAEKVVSETEAISGMKIKAAQFGADAITNIVCQRKTGLDWVNNCFESIICVGDAIKITNSSLIPKGSKVASSSIKSSGTGWVVDGGFIVTNYHVVENKSKISILIHGNNAIPAKLYVKDRHNDLAILEVTNKNVLPSSIPISSNATNVGETVFTIGYPLTDIMGKEPKMTDGIISANTGIQDDPRVYQITVPLQPGNSGGPLLNLKGEVVGVTTSKLNAFKIFQWSGDIPQNINYAVKSVYVKALLSNSNSKKMSTEVLERKEDSLESLFQKLKQSIVIVQAE